MSDSRQWATLVIAKGQGGRSVIVNESDRGLFSRGQLYYNHRLKQFPFGSRLNVVVRFSATGRRMVKKITVKGGGQ